MTPLCHDCQPSDQRWDRVVAMFRTAQMNQGRLIAEARKEWERRFADNDPSDTCVTIRINGKDSREFARLFPFESSDAGKTFVAN